jgi:dTDP-4-amino-4,6-dideoxygalactose transaminase
MKQRIDALRNFGFSDNPTVVSIIGIGSNGKMNEFSAAVGLAQLPHIDAVLARREHVASRYITALEKSSRYSPTVWPGASSQLQLFSDTRWLQLSANPRRAA